MRRGPPWQNRTIGMGDALMIIDAHSHFFPHAWPDFAERFGGVWPSIEHRTPGQAMIMLGDREFRPVDDKCWDAAARLADLDRNGVAMQVICATPVLFAYDKPVEQAVYVARYFNDAALEICAAGKGRLRAFAQVPMQDIDAACRMVSQAVGDGHLGVQIGNHVGDRDLDDEGLITFLQHCADEGAAVFVHPWDMMGGNRMSNWMLPWLVAMPAETQLSMLSLILSGAFERLPETLRICFAHGGGSFAYLIGRVNNAWRRRDIVRKDCPELPSSYARRMFVDSAVFSDGSLRLLADVMGSDRIVLGTDYPFPLGEEKLGAGITGCPLLSVGEKRAMLSDNALAFLNLSSAESIAFGASSISRSG